MPIYEYICDDCGKRFELIRKFADANNPVECKTCQSHQTHRAISVFNAQSGGKVLAGTSSCGCGSCAGGACSSCNSN